MAPRRLAANVVKRNPDTGIVEAFEAGSTPPDWAAGLIDPDSEVWAPEPEVEAEVKPEVVAPPRTGAGSGRAAWANYAESLGFVVDDDMSREQIIEAVEAP